MSLEEYFINDKLRMFISKYDLPFLVKKIDQLEDLSSIIVNKYTVLDLIFDIRQYDFKIFLTLVNHIWPRVQKCSSEYIICYRFIKYVQPYLQLVNDSKIFESQLSPSDAKVLKQYGGKAFSAINKYLRSGEIETNNIISPDPKELAIKLDQILTSSNIPKTQGHIIVFRGINNQDFENFLNSLEIGNIYEEPAFSSTSLQSKTTKYFAGDMCCLLKIILPEGVPCLYFQKYAEFPSEQEVLLPTGMGLILKNVEMINFYGYPMKMFTFVCQYCTIKSRYHHLKPLEDWDHVNEQKY